MALTRGKQSRLPAPHFARYRLSKVVAEEDLTQPHVDAGRLRRVLDGSCPSFPGLHAYYPSHRNSSRALRVVIDAIRHQL